MHVTDSSARMSIAFDEWRHDERRQVVRAHACGKHFTYDVWYQGQCITGVYHSCIGSWRINRHSVSQRRSDVTLRQGGKERSRGVRHCQDFNLLMTNSGKSNCCTCRERSIAASKRAVLTCGVEQGPGWVMRRVRSRLGTAWAAKWTDTPTSVECCPSPKQYASP